MRTTLFFVFLFVATKSFADVPSEFTAQGVLRDSAGKLQTMAANVTVNLYDAQTAGNVLAGPYVAMAVPVSNGLFTVTFGDPQLRQKIGSAANVWIEVDVGTDVFSRQRMSTQPFALMCQTADSATNFSGALGGDVTGTQSGTTVAKLQGRAMSNAAPAMNNTLRWNGTTWAPSPNVIFCSGTSANDNLMAGASTWTHKFVASECGGTLPDATYIGALSTLSGCDGFINFQTFLSNDARYPGAYGFIAGGGACAPLANYLLQVTYIKQ